MIKKINRVYAIFASVAVIAFVITGLYFSLVKPTSEPAVGNIIEPDRVERVLLSDAGYYHALAVDANGDLYSWGSNESGELGIGTTGRVATNYSPQLVTLPGQTGDIVQIDAGLSSSMALTSSNQVYLWGDNEYGKIGQRSLSPTYYENPQLLPELPGRIGDIKQVMFAGYSTYILTASNQIYSWGYNATFQLGREIPNYDYSLIPGLVNLPEIEGDIVKMFCGKITAGILTTTGQVIIWGEGKHGEHGNNTAPTTIYPVFHTPIFNNLEGKIIDVSMNGYTAIALSSSNQVYAWGAGGDGQLGVGFVTTVALPRIVSTTPWADDTIQDVNCSYYACFVSTEKKVYATGRNNKGELGLGNETRYSTYREISLNLENDEFVHHSGGDGFSMVIAESGSLYTWGGNNFGQLGGGNATEKDVNWTPQVRFDIDLRRRQEGFAIAGGDRGKFVTENDFLIETVNGKGTGGIFFFSSNPAIISINRFNGLAKIHGIGTAIITAEKAGDEDHFGTSTQIEVSVRKTPLNNIQINGGEDIIKDYGDHNFTLNVSGALGEGEMIYTSANPNIATIDQDSGEVTIVGAGTVTLSVQKKGDALYEDSIVKEVNLVVRKAVQRNLVLESEIERKLVGDLPFDLIVSGGEGPGQYVYESLDTDVAVISDEGVITVLGAGRAMFNVYREESANYLRSNILAVEFDVETPQTPKGYQSDLVINNTDTEKLTTDADFTLNITGGNGNGEIVLTSSDSSILAIVEGKVIIRKEGEATISAYKKGDANYFDSEQASITYKIKKPKVKDNTMMIIMFSVVGTVAVMATVAAGVVVISRKRRAQLK